MKRRLFFIFALSLSSISLLAQSNLDAYKLSKNDLRGSARAIGMGGAFGALGGDMTGVAINPAGIGSYTQAEVATTLNFANTKTEANFNTSPTEMSKFKFNFDNISYIGTLPLAGDAVKSLNFGFAYNRLKNFDRKFVAHGKNQPSMSHYMADRANHYAEDGGVTDYDLAMDNGKYPFPLDELDWMAVLGYNSWLIEPLKDAPTTWKSSLTSKPESNSVYMQEKGYINSYDFNFGFDISDIVGVGATLAVTDISYHLESQYDEYLQQGADAKYYFLDNWLSTEGAGIQAKIGVILKPINEFRIGIAYHSPTWYNMTDSYEAQVEHKLNGFLNAADYENAILNTYYANGEIGSHTDYKLQTPDKWVFSAATVIAQRAIISLDYELTNYKNMKLKDDYSREFISNEYIKQDFRLTSTLRAGAEVRFTPRVSGRIGYAWMQSPLSTEFKNQEQSSAVPVGSVPHYTLEGDTHHFTYGLGYRFTKNFYGDVAFVMKWQEDDVYAFPPLDPIAFSAGKGTLKTNTFQGLVTLGYRF